MKLQDINFEVISNSHTKKELISDSKIFHLSEVNAVIKEIKNWHGYKQTPLYSLKNLAKKLNICEIYYKDEGERFVLESFKALGAYAVNQVIKKNLYDRTKKLFTTQELCSDTSTEFLKDLTITCATDGNYGRAVAWACQMFGCQSVIFLHEAVTQTRENEIAKYGAKIVRVRGSYDDSVVQCYKEAEINNRIVVSDTSWEGYEDIPRLVMQGYSIIAQEITEQLSDNLPTHIFVPAGVGGLLCCMAGYFAQNFPGKRTAVVSVEPIKSKCVYQSIKEGKRVVLQGDYNSFMGCLCAGEVSSVAWEIIKGSVDASIIISDNAAKQTMKFLYDGIADGKRIFSGESGCSSLAALLAVKDDSKSLNVLNINEKSRILLIGTEGATDKEVFSSITGHKF